ncbi:YraN family protein [Helicobacter sp. MIT 14-3879]|uniref:YraN family protein n=1 Tax=Helicobacter sp. MIT 14-3879 TaxID=2040649 RepID=UPI000E1E572C|nr:YraN family protein [Helicobacter sp. MIT 14-3879]RDU61396.1 YraN family protein [Helicobacter sp. MIT 14-3879]
MPKTKGDSVRIGRQYEEIALQYLASKGFGFIAKNFHSRYGEIDLIMQKNGVLHFIEVKSSRSINPLLKITPAKLHKIIKTIYVFLAQYEYSCDFCIDALAIYQDHVAFVENVTLFFENFTAYNT